MKKKEKEEDDPLGKLMKLTKLMKAENVQVAPKGPPKGANKWRSQDPKFAPKAPKSENVVQAGGMDVDPARQQEYENWRQDKLAEQAERRAQIARKKEAERLERIAQRKKDLEGP